VRIPRSSGSREEPIRLSQHRPPNEYRVRLDIPRDARTGESVTVTPDLKLPDKTVTGTQLRFRLEAAEKKEGEK
jgi:hypothetical protein